MHVTLLVFYNDNLKRNFILQFSELQKFPDLNRFSCGVSSGRLRTLTNKQTVCIVKFTFFYYHLYLLGRPRNFPLSWTRKFIIMLTKWRYFNLSHFCTLFISEVSVFSILLSNYTLVSPHESRPLSFSDQTCACSSLFHLACKVTSLSLC